jgi:hypothetical protein
LLQDYLKSEHLNKRSQNAEVFDPDQAIYFLIQNSFVLHSHFNSLHKKSPLVSPGALKLDITEAFNCYRILLSKNI